MPDPLILRIERVVRNSAERALELAERASGVVLVREAARELERADDRLHTDRDAAERKGKRATEAQGATRTKIAELGDHAAYALSRGREDLARAALARQVELEQEVEDWAVIASETKVELKCIDEALALVVARRKQIEGELAALERQQAATAQPWQGNEIGRRRAAAAIDRADRLIDRATAKSADQDGTSHRVAEIEAMRRHDAIEERLAKMKAKAASSPKSSMAEKSSKGRKRN